MLPVHGSFKFTIVATSLSNMTLPDPCRVVCANHVHDKRLTTKIIGVFDLDVIKLFVNMALPRPGNCVNVP